VSDGEEEKWERPSSAVPTCGIRPASPRGAAATSGVWSPSAVAHVHWRPLRAVKRCLSLTSGPRLHFEFPRFSIFQTLKSKMVTFPLLKIQQILHRDIWKHKEQLSFLAQLQIPSGFHVTYSGTNSNLNLP
jgi:hypothetical protein